MFGNYINGEWIASGATFENRNPANTDEVVGTFVKGTAADIDAAAAAAAAAFPGWCATQRTGARQHPVQGRRHPGQATSSPSPPT